LRFLRRGFIDVPAALHPVPGAGFSFSPLRVPSRNDTEDRLRKTAQHNGFSNRVSPASKPGQQNENDKKMKEVTAVRSQAKPALVAYFFVPHFFVIKFFF
jgi:hypothetical protein